MGKFEGLSRQRYLEQAPVRSFVDYLVELLAGNRLDHGYEIDDKRWQKRRREMGLTNEMVICSLDDARQQYFWMTEVDSSDGDDLPNPTTACDLESNTKRLEKLAKALTTAIEADHEGKAFLAAMAVLDWGQVWRGSAKWLIRHHQAGRLIARISDATSILSGSTHDGLDRFDDDDLRLDSGLTKVYSLASRNRSIIYDDRVAAALGLLVGKHCRLSAAHPKAPALLRFAAGSAVKGRRPNSLFKRAGFETKKVGGGGRVWAKWNLRANWILASALQRHQQENRGKSVWKTIRDIEAALFMVGYRIA